MKRKKNNKNGVGPGRAPATRLAALAAVAVVGWSSLAAAGLPGHRRAPAGERPAGLTSAEVRALVERIQPRVEEIRGLRFKQPVRVSVVGNEQVREHVLRRFEKFETETELEAEARALALLGILPPGTDVLQEYMDVIREQAGGFYDPDTKSFYVLRDMPRGLAPVIASHELTHALEDQHYDLDRRLIEAMANDDEMFAMSAVGEGSAMLLMSMYVANALLEGSLTESDLEQFSETEAAKGENLAEVPPALLRPLVGAYVLGAQFLVERDMGLLFSEGYPAARVDQVYEDGPRSSEQILHPEKYWDPEQRDEPTTVRLRDAGRRLGKRWEKRSEGVLGELTLGSMVGAPTPLDPASLLGAEGTAWTNPAAAGWDGDRWELWTNRDSAVVLLSTVWDSPNDANQFAQALEERGSLSWKREGSRVAVVAGDAGGREQKLLNRMLEIAGRE